MTVQLLLEYVGVVVVQHSAIVHCLIVAEMTGDVKRIVAVLMSSV